MWGEVQGSLPGGGGAAPTLVSVEWVGVKLMKNFHGEDPEMHTACLGNQKRPRRLMCRALHKAGEAGASQWPE